jgi:hypothetical protein
MACKTGRAAACHMTAKTQASPPHHGRRHASELRTRNCHSQEWQGPHEACGHGHVGQLSCTAAACRAMHSLSAPAVAQCGCQWHVGFYNGQGGLLPVPSRQAHCQLAAVLAFAAETMLPHVAGAMLTLLPFCDVCCSTTSATGRDSRCAAACTRCRLSRAPVPRTGDALTRRGPTPATEHLIDLEHSIAGATS